MSQKLTDKLFKLLFEDNYSLVVSTKAGSVLTFNNRGVYDLFSLYTTSKENLAGASVADRAVGIGAAVLMVLGKVKEVRTAVISEDALNLLKTNGISVEADRIVPYIVNRAGDGRCPLETRLAPIVTYNLNELYDEIRVFLIEKGILDRDM